MPAIPLSPPAPVVPLAELEPSLASAGYAVLGAAALARLAQAQGADPGFGARWSPLWNDLPPDAYLKDGGHYRRRRHGCFVVEGDRVEAVPRRAHWQPLDYNALHGGIERWFEPLPAVLSGDPDWAGLLRGLAGVATARRQGAPSLDARRGAQPWYVEAHLFRIDTTDGIGRPTPEGAHRDGVDFVAVVLVDRSNVKGGETRVFDLAGPQGLRFTLAEPWSVLLLDDQRVIHETTPIQPQDAARPAHRDTLVITLRAGGFQGPTERTS